MDRMLLDQLAGEALRELLHAVQGTLFCRSTAERLRRSVEPLLPLVQGLGPHSTQRSAGELGELAARVREALDLARRVPALERLPRRAAVASDGGGRPRHRTLAGAPRPRARHRRRAQAPRRGGRAHRSPRHISYSAIVTFDTNI
jgi:hypothetical protein